MAKDKLHSLIVKFLNAQGDEQNPVIEDGNSDYAHALTSMWASEKIERDKLKAHFAKLDESYKTRIVDLQTKHDVFDDARAASLMKAALDDIDEHSPDHLFGGNTSIIPDDIIRAFLADDDGE